MSKEKIVINHYLLTHTVALVSTLKSLTILILNYDFPHFFAKSVFALFF